MTNIVEQLGREALLMALTKPVQDVEILYNTDSHGNPEEVANPVHRPRTWSAEQYDSAREVMHA